MLGNLVLASEVSGGSAAIAYFAMHRDRLDKGDGESWNRMAAPFIQDVLRGASGWRMADGGWSRES